MELITSRDNPKIRRAIKLQSGKRQREKEGLFCCEGEKLLKEALACGVQVEQIFISQNFPEERRRDWGPEAYLVTQRLMEQMSGVETPQGLLFVCRAQAPLQLPPPGECLILEDVRDPGNLGTAVRTAEAFDVPLVMTEGCAELYNPKTIRSTMGSVFRAKLCRAPAETIFDALDRRGTPLYAAALSPQAQDVRQAQLKGAAVAVGNEARGVSPALLRRSQGQVVIPIQGAESLNAGVAAALLMWEMRRSR
ncbi:MAG: RNA methyltransferase [Clostridiaceae bacterium]|jgi:TrmH family RNA methyltransferase|nr:RNA methyltransferase [Clostridiaceae bacterium]